MRLLLGKATPQDLKDFPGSFQGLEIVYPLYLTWTQAEQARFKRLVRQDVVQEIAWRLPAVWLANEEMRHERRELLRETQATFPSHLRQHVLDSEIADPFWDSKPRWESAALLCIQGRHPARWVRRYGQTQLTKFARAVARLEKKDGIERSVILAYSGRKAEAEALRNFYDEAKRL